MTLLGYVRAIVTGWWIVAIALIAGLGLAMVYNSISTPVYASSVKFFVSTQTDVGGSALAADEFAQRRINSYVQLLTSESMARQIIASSGVDLSVAEVSSRINAYSDPETVLLGVEIQDTDKDRSFALARAVADEFGQLVSTLDNRGDAELANVKLNVVSGPTLNEDAISPKKPLNLVLGAIVGLALGATIAIVRKTSRRAIGTAAELEDALELPVLASVPRLRPRGSATRPGEEGRDPAERVGLPVERLVASLGLDVAKPRQQVIQVSSAHTGDGRSLVTGYLGMALTRFHAKVLIIDADLTHPSLSAAFGQADAPGLSDYLAGRAEAEDVIVQTSTPGLSIIPAGRAHVDAAPGFAAARFAQLIEYVRSTSDVAVVDTAPLIPRIDASLIGRLSDGAVLVVGRDRATRPQLLRGMEALAPAGTLVLGAVLNSAPRPPRQRGGARTRRDAQLQTLLAQPAAAPPSTTRRTARAEP